MKTFIQFIEEETEDHIESLAKLIHAKTQNIEDMDEVNGLITSHVISHPAYKGAENPDDFGSDVRDRVLELRKTRKGS
jgi:hypothetical protein